MSKKSIKIIATYFITFIVSFILFGGAAYLAYEYVLFEDNSDASADLLSIEKEDNSPAFSENKTTLLILDTQNSEKYCNFMIMRFVASEGRIVFLPLPTNIEAEVGGVSATLYDFYQSRGVSELINAVEAEFGFKPDKYIKFSEQSFTDAVDILGKVDYNVPNDMLYTNEQTGEQTIFYSGINTLDSISMLKLLTYPNYDFAEEYTAKVMAICISDLFNRNQDDKFVSNMNSYFTAFINSDIETDISVYDFEESLKSILYAYDSSSDLSSFILISGVIDANGNYNFDEGLMKNLESWLVLKETE